MNNKMKCMQFSPLYPLKGRIAAYKCQTNLVVIAPLRGLGVN